MKRKHQLKTHLSLLYHFTQTKAVFIHQQQLQYFIRISGRARLVRPRHHNTWKKFTNEDEQKCDEIHTIGSSHFSGGFRRPKNLFPQDSHPRSLILVPI